MSYQILIVEDEPQIARRLSRLSKDILGDRLAQVSCTFSVEMAEQKIDENDVDLILLDLNLAGEDGFSLLKHFTAKAAHTIVVSAQTERAIEAFEYGVLDFVPKPFSRTRLEKAISRLWSGPEATKTQAKHLSFETHRSTDIISTHEIIFFKGADKYSEAMLANGEIKFHSKSLNRLEDILSGEFVRTHKSYLVHQQAISGLKSLEGSRYELQLSSGENLPVGRTRINHVRQLLDTRVSI